MMKYIGYFLMIPGFLILVYYAYLYLSDQETQSWIAAVGLIMCAFGAIIDRKLRKPSN
jgi:lipoprotein signal peptidase